MIDYSSDSIWKINVDMNVDQLMSPVNVFVIQEHGHVQDVNPYMGPTRQVEQESL